MLRHWWQYAALVIAAVACESAVYFVWPNDLALSIAGVVFQPVVAAFVYALAGRDEGVVPDPWRRALRRAGFVVVLDFISALASSSALESFSAGAAFAGIALLAVTTSLIYADVFAVLTEPLQGLLIARSIERSAIAAWNGLDNIGRSISLIALQLLVFLASQKLQVRFEAAHLQHASFWAQVPLGTILIPPLSALTALVYLDSTGHEANRSRGE